MTRQSTPTRLVQLLAAWGTDEAPADVDCDGLVGVDDLLLVLGAWGPCR